MNLLELDTPVAVNGEAIDELLASELPVLMLVWNGETLRGDVRTELDNLAKEFAGRMIMAKVDLSKSAEDAERFDIGKHPVLMGVVNGEILTRRNRPWNTDIRAAAEEMRKYAPEPAPSTVAKVVQKTTLVDNKPVKVTEQTFEKDVIQSQLPVVVDFWADWCGPCKQIAPILEKLAGEYAGKVRVAKVDVDANPGLSQTFNIMSIPTLMFIKGGKIVGQQAGALPEHVLRDVFNQLVALKV